MGILNMRDKKVLANSAMISAIWDEKKRDNIELLKPFVIYLLGDIYNVGEEIDCDKICGLMDKKFSFVKFPIAVLKKIFARMKQTVVRSNNKYYLVKEVKEEYDKFKKDHQRVIAESREVIEAIRNYLKDKRDDFKTLSYEETQNLFTIFLEENGFTGAYDIKKLKDIKRFKTSESNFFIAKYIVEESEKESRIFELIYNIICGFMISNTIYMQVENNNSESLKKLDCYLDSPFILNVLGYKTNEQNKSAKRLIELLQEKNASIKCFKHNFEEVSNIIKNYKDNLNNRFKEKTLESLDIQKYKEKDVDIILKNLENIFRSNHIQIVDTPDYNEYKPTFEESELTSFLEENYNDKEEKITRIIEQDVKSISAIARLRRGEKYDKLEKSKAIFITTSTKLVHHIENFTKKKPFEEIGYVISDMELTTVLWLKTFKKNPDLPKMKLIENARTALEPSPSIMKNFKETLERMQKSGIINDADVIENIQLEWYQKSEEFMEKISGNEENINPKIIKGIFAKENDNLKIAVNIEKEAKKQLEIEKQQKEDTINKTKSNIIKQCREKTECYKNIACKIIKIIITLFFGSLLVIQLYNLLFEEISNTMTIFYIIGILIDIVGMCDILIPKCQKINKKINRFIDELGENYYEKKIEEKKKELPELFSED